MFTVFKKVTNPSATFTQEDVDKVNDFVFCRWLSGDYRTLPLANKLNEFPNIPMKLKLLLAQKYIQGKVKYIPFPKSLKDETQVYKEISFFYNVSEEKAKEYLEFLSQDDLKEIHLTFLSVNQ